MPSTAKKKMLEECNKFVTNPGEMFEPIYEGQLQEDGQIKLIKVGMRDLASERNAWKDSCDINIIVERFQAGEIDVFQQVQGVYTDITTAPKDLASAIVLGRNAENTFDRLPIDVKNAYDNNFMLWLGDAGSEDWLMKNGFIKDSKDGDSETRSI